VASYNRFKTVRNQVQNLIRAAKKNYYLSIFSNNDRPTEIWNKLKHLGLIKVKDSHKIFSHSVDELNAYFSEIGTLSDDITSYNTDAHVWRDCEDSFDENKFYFKYVTPDVIVKSLSRIKSHAVGMDGISLRIIKMTLPFVMPLIEHMFNYSLMYGIVPHIWKSAIIMPLSKVRQPSAVQHYRPISILPFLSKVLERIVSDQVLEFLEDNELQDPCQFAYRRNSSTQTCIIKMLDDIRQASDDRRVTISIFFDFSKAFDRVNYKVLLNKLKDMGLSCIALHWMASYLRNKTQAVYDKFEDVTSSLACINADVPQGSVLGPLLYAIYVSDMCNVLNHCKYNFYADDLQIYLHCKPCHLQNGIRQVNEDIESIVNWAHSSGLMLNSTKT